MKFRIGHFEYNEDRTGNPYLFTVIGTPETKAEWDNVKGETRQTMTLAEIEAKGIALPDAIAQGNAEAAKRADAVSGDLATVTAERDALATKLQNVANALKG